jgi:hypothetical protein
VTDVVLRCEGREPFVVVQLHFAVDGELVLVELDLDILIADAG